MNWKKEGIITCADNLMDPVKKNKVEKSFYVTMWGRLEHYLKLAIDKIHKLLRNN